MSDNCTVLQGLYDACNASYVSLAAAYDACGCDALPVDCSSAAVADYNMPLHIGAVFIILGASLFGAALPLISKSLVSGPAGFYCIAVGKCVGTGVVLACALIHMLQPANEELTDPCAPAEFNTNYSAYAYLIAMLAAMAMHLVELLIRLFFEFAVKDIAPVEEPQSPPASPDEVSEITAKATFSPDVCSHGHGHGGSLLAADPHPALSRVLAAVMMEFGVAVHSIFIGVATGIVPDDELKTLLIALSFHQFFEGIALGARLCDASTLSSKMDYFLAVIFAVSAPVGMAAGIGAIGSINTAGPSYLVMQGIFDSICAGVLLYLGFDLLIRDFAEDAKRAASAGYSRYILLAMLVGLWGGGGVMAAIGKYL